MKVCLVVSLSVVNMLVSDSEEDDILYSLMNIGCSSSYFFMVVLGRDMKAESLSCGR